PAVERTCFRPNGPRRAHGASRNWTRSRTVPIPARAVAPGRDAASDAPGLAVAQDRSRARATVSVVTLRPARQCKVDLLSPGHCGRLLLRVGHARARRTRAGRAVALSSPLLGMRPAGSRPLSRSGSG